FRRWWCMRPVPPGAATGGLAAVAERTDGRLLHCNIGRVMLHRTNRQSLPDHQQEPAMYQNINEQFSAGARQFAETAAQVNRLALSSAEKAFGLQLSTLEENTNAAF